MMLRSIARRRVTHVSMATLLFSILVGAGCGTTGSTYKVPDHNPAEADTVLVMPFFDSRSFRDPEDPMLKTTGANATRTFIKTLQSHAVFRTKTLIAPHYDAPVSPPTMFDMLSAGRGQNADLVMTGQVYSYTETRAASIPPRAGIFLRIVSVPEERIVFVGDHYSAAGAPGSEGGRQKQLEIAATEVLNAYLAANPARKKSASASNVTRTVKDAEEDAPVVLMLPYHDRENPNNLIEKTGGGAVVTSIYQMEIALQGKVKVIPPTTNRVGHGSLPTADEALSLGREYGADYVVRGQVVEFRRSMSVPSFYSVIISWAILAAQTLFAEVTGVDIATEVYRVEDGACIYAKRDTSRQKYVVQAEKTVRRLAAETGREMVRAVTKNPSSQKEVAPIIESIVPEKLGRKSREDVSEEKAAPAAKEDDNGGSPGVIKSGTVVKKGEAIDSEDDPAADESTPESDSDGQDEDDTEEGDSEVNEDDEDAAIRDREERLKSLGRED